MKKISIILAILATAGTAMAQDTVNGVYNERVVVVGSYKPELQETQKVNVAPTITDTISSADVAHKFTYEISPKRLTSLFSPSRIKAARVIGEPTTKLYDNYLKLGLGNYWSPLFEAYYNSTRNKTMTYGGYLTHRSSWGTIGRKVDSLAANPDYYGANHWSMTEVGGFGKYIIKDKYQVSADLSYNNDHNLYYGFSDSTLAAHGLTRDSLSRSDYKIAYNVISFNGGVRNLQTDVNKLGFSANVGFDQLFATYGQRELMGHFNGDVHYGFPLLSKYKGIAYLEAEWLGGREKYYYDVMPYGFDATVPDTTRQSRNLIKLNPYVDFIFRDFNVHAGARVALDGFSDTTSHFYFYPDVMVSKTMMRESLNLSVGITGDVDANTLNAIRMVNPYMAPGSSLMASRTTDFYAKMRLNFNKKLQFNAHFNLDFVKNGLNFALDSSYMLENVYTTNYEDYTRSNIGADFSFVNDEMLTLELGANYYGYSDSTLLYRPKFDAHLNVKVNYNDKIIGRLQGLLLGQMNSSLTTDANGTVCVAERLPMRTGLNLEVEYRHNKALSFFAKVDNILCQRYFYWTNYPSQKILVMLGLTYTIPTL